MESFEVENFRSLKHLKLEKMARVNLLVGKNNSGKTSVLEVVYVLTRVELADWFESLETARGIENEDQDLRSLFYKFNTGNRVEVKATYNGGTPSNYGFTLETLSEPNVRRRKGVKSLLVFIQVGADNPYGVVMTREEKYGQMEYDYDPLTSEAEDFLEQGLPGELGLRHVCELLGTTIDLESLSSHLSDLTINKEEEKLIEIVKLVDSRIKALSLDSKGRIHFDLGESFSTLSSINHMGEGIQRLLSVAAAIANNAGGIVLIDEIDNGLHYSALRILWKGILQAAREYDVQIITTTHSVEALRHLTWVLDEEENASYRDDVAAYTLIRADDDTVRSYRYGAEQLEYALEHDIEVRN